MPLALRVAATASVVVLESGARTHDLARGEVGAGNDIAAEGFDCTEAQVRSNHAFGPLCKS